MEKRFPKPVNCITNFLFNRQFFTVDNEINNSFLQCENQLHYIGQFGNQFS